MPKPNGLRYQAPTVLAWLFLICAHPLYGQSEIVVVGAGYASPTPILVAPGQVVTLFIHGFGTERRAEASAVPLPTTLDEISVRLQYSRSGESFPAPIFSIAPIPGDLAAITVQIPFELKVPPQLGPPMDDTAGVAQLVVSEAGVPGKPIDLAATSDNIHVLNFCDRPPEIEPEFNYNKLTPCIFDVATHADDVLVSFDKPAKTGETIVLYALGLGLTNSDVRTGDATPNDAPVTEFAEAFRVSFGFPGPPSLELTPAKPEFVGLTPGSIGLYQVNVRVPALPPETPTCNSEFPRENLTVTVTGPRSWDVAKLCAER